MQPVLDPPMASHQAQQLAGGGILGGEAGDDIGGLAADLTFAPAGVDQPSYLPQTRPVRPLIQVGGDGEFAKFLAISVAIALAHRDQRGDRLLKQQLHSRVQRWLVGFQPEKVVPPFSRIFWQMSRCANSASPVTIWPFKSRLSSTALTASNSCPLPPAARCASTIPFRWA